MLVHFFRFSSSTNQPSVWSIFIHQSLHPSSHPFILPLIHPAAVIHLQCINIDSHHWCYYCTTKTSGGNNNIQQLLPFGFFLFVLCLFWYRFCFCFCFSFALNSSHIVSYILHVCGGSGNTSMCCKTTITTSTTTTINEEETFERINKHSLKSSLRLR